MKTGMTETRSVPVRGAFEGRSFRAIGLLWFLLPVLAACAMLVAFKQTVELTPQAIGQWGAGVSDGPNYAYQFSFEPPPFGLVARPDSASTRSALVLLEDGVELTRPRSLHLAIVNEGAGRYSHWGQPRADTVIFSSSDNSDPRTNGRTYVAERPLAIDGVLLFSGIVVIAVAGFGVRFLHGGFESATRGLLAADMITFLTTILMIPSIVLIIALVFLPSHPGIRDFIASEWKEMISFIYLQFPNMLFLSSAIWIIFEGTMKKGIAINKGRVAILSWFFIVGVLYFALIIVSQRLAINALQNLNSPIGLLQYSDAAGYVNCDISAVATGATDSFCSRRPYATGMRLLAFSMFGFDIQLKLLLQAAGVASAAAAICTILARQVGMPSALLFFGFCLLHTRAFAPTMLTEMIGAGLSILSVGALLLAWRSSSTLTNAYAAVGLSTLAQFSRMGALFTIPAVMAAVLIAVHNGQWRRTFTAGVLIVGVVAMVVVGPFAFNRLYGDGTGVVGGNFSYTLAGLSLGGDWASAAERYAEELAALPGEASVSSFLYGEAIRNIRENPDVFLTSLLSAYALFFSYADNFFFGGYSGYGESSFNEFLSIVIFVIFIASFIFSVNFKSEWRQLMFFLFYIVGYLASIPILIRDDGWRVTIVSTIMLSFLFSYFFRSKIDRGSK